MNSAKEQEVEDLTTPPPRAKSTAPASEKKPKATKRRLSSQEAVPPQLEEAVKETATTVETAAMTELLGKNQSGEAASAQPKPKPKPAKGAKSKSEKIGTGNPQEPLMKKPGKAAKAKKKDQKGADQTDQTEAPEGEAIKQEQRPTSAPAAAAVVAAEVPKVKPIRLLLKCASSSGGQQDGPPATSSEAATRMDVVDLNESRPQPSERPKWKKLLQRGKGGQRLDVDAEEAKKDPPRLGGQVSNGSWFPPPPSKRKTPEEDGQQPVQSKAPEADQDPAKPAPKGLARLGFHPIPKEAPKEKDLPPVEAVEVSEAPEADQDPAKPAPKGLARLGFHPIPKEAPKEKDLPPVEAVEVSEAPDATDDVVDLEAKTPRFDWTDGGRGLDRALSTGDGEAQSQAPPVTEVLEVPDERDSTTTQRPLTKQGSKKVLQKEAPSLPVKDWSERNAPTVLKQLKPKKAWEDFRSWLRTWRPGQKGKEAALITGACGSGKSAGVRLIVRKWRENFIEYDLADVKGRSFFENLAKKQRNGNQLSEEASAQVLICNISEPITVTQKESLALAIQASKVPIVFTGPDGIFTSKDAISKLCFELRISLADAGRESSIAKQIHEVSRRENAELPMELCTQDLRKALQVAQLLSAGVLSGSVGGACLPQTALAPLTAYDRLLRKPEDTCGSLSWRSHSLTVQVDDLFMAPCLAGCQMSIPLMHKILQNDPAVCFGLPMSSLLIQHAPTRPQTKTKREKLVEMDDAHPLVQWNCLPALAFAFDRRSWAAKASNLVELDQDCGFEEKEARKTEDDNHLETKDDKEEESQLIEEDEKDEEKEENQREAEDENCPEEDRKETVEGEVLKAEEESFPEEKEDPPAEAEIEPSAQADVEMTSPPEVWSIEVSQAELQDLETCARRDRFFPWSYMEPGFRGGEWRNDVANYLAQQAAEEAGPTMDLRESGMTSPADELEEVHEEEVSRLRAELREVEDKMMPSPRISPPVLANEGDADQQEVKEAKDQAAETLLIPVEVRHVDIWMQIALPAPDFKERGSEEKDKLKLKPPTLNLYRGSSNASFVSSLVSPPIPEEEEDDLEHPAIALPSRIGNLFVEPHFEMVVAILLFVNLILMASQLQYHGFITGYEIGYPRYDTSPKDSWPYAEMMVRLLKIRWAFFNAFLNWIDFLVVCSSWAELFAAALPISPTFLRMLRLGKLLRALRVVRMSAVLESLQLLCIFASLRILFWSLVLLMVIQCSAGMTISYMLSDYMVNPEGDAAAQFEVFRYYGTFTKTLLTMFDAWRMLFANWAPAARVLIDNVSEWYSLAFIVYRCFVGFAVLNVVNAVFVQSTMKVAHADDEIVAHEKAKSQEAYRRRVSKLFWEADISGDDSEPTDGTAGDGFIDFSEFKRLLEHPQLQVWLYQLEIETGDLEGLFRLLDDGDGEISLDTGPEEFEAGVMKLKGFARAFDLNKLQRQVRKMNAKMDLLIHNSGLSHFRNDKPKGRAMSSPGCSETTPPFWAKNRGLSRDTF
eukprot:g2618.t1